MPIQSYNYTDRLVDFYIMDLPQDTHEGRSSLSFSSPSRICTGIQKLVQVYVITLMTSVGSKVLDSTYGTTIGDVFVGSNIFTEEILRHILNTANREALNIIQLDQEALKASGRTLDSDEELVEANLYDLTFPQKDTVSVKAELITVGGDTISFTVPINFSITR